MRTFLIVIPKSEVETAADDKGGGINLYLELGFIACLAVGILIYSIKQKANTL